MNGRALGLALLLGAAGLGVYGPAEASPRPAAEPTIARARELEKNEQWPAARDTWERVIDSCDSTTAQRAEAVAKIKDLNPRVPPNTDPARANVWTIKAFVFKTLDFRWTPKEGQPQEHVTIRFTDEEIAHLRARLARFAEMAFEFSRGQLRIDSAIEIIEEPVTRLSGKGSFWLAPWDVRDLIKGRYEPGKVDTVFGHVKVSDGKGAGVPAAMLGGAFGGDVGPGGAGWVGIMWAPRSLRDDPDGEAELHEWLHTVDWSFAKRLHYADEIVPNPDGGRMEGQDGGDPDYRRKPEEKNWQGFYRHVMGEHITSRMWQEARCRPFEGCGRRWLVAGPIPYAGEPGAALDKAPGDPARAPATGDKADGAAWKSFESAEDFIDLLAACGGGRAIACAFAKVVSDADCDACLWLGYDDSVVAYVNGQEVYRFVGGHAAAPDDAAARVRLRKGENTVLLKVLDMGGGWGFYARFADDRGRPLAGVKWAD